MSDHITQVMCKFIRKVRMKIRFILFIFTISFLISPNYILRKPASYVQKSKVGVLGDLEGNLFRFNDFIDNSGTFSRSENGEITLRQGHQFVFLGDAADRGAGSIRIMETLLELKEKYPEKVTLILGNRDITKMRIYSILKKNEDGPIPEEIVWYYKKILKKDHGVTFKGDPPIDQFRRIAADYDSPVLRFKALLLGMNSPKAFEYRREELQILNGVDDLSDKLVYEDFMKNFSKGGLYDRYLSQGQIGKVIDGNLFVHGAITSENIGYIPGVRNKELDVYNWIDKLNKWAHKEITDWVNDWSLGKGLVKYHAPKLGSIQNLLSVIYSRFSNSTGNAIAPSRYVMNLLKKQGIFRIIVGHTPVGDFPFIVRKGDFEIVLADSSYSTIETSSKIEIRGKELTIESIDHNGQKIIIESSILEVNNPIGMRTNDGYRVIGLIDKTNDFVMMKVEGSGRDFKAKYKIINDKKMVLRNLIENQNSNKSCAEIVENFFSSMILKKYDI